MHRIMTREEFKAKHGRNWRINSGWSYNGDKTKDHLLGAFITESCYKRMVENGRGYVDTNSESFQTSVPRRDYYFTMKLAWIVEDSYIGYQTSKFNKISIFSIIDDQLPILNQRV